MLLKKLIQVKNKQKQKIHKLTFSREMNTYTLSKVVYSFFASVGRQTGREAIRFAKTEKPETSFIKQTFGARVKIEPSTLSFCFKNSRCSVLSEGEKEQKFFRPVREKNLLCSVWGKLVEGFLECFIIVVFLVFLILICGAFFPLDVWASQIDELKSKISMQSIELQKVEKEIEEWEERIEIVGQEKQSLSRDVRRLNTTRKKLNSDIYLTGRRIATANLNIEKLGLEINEKKDGIQKNSLALAEAIRTINEQETYTLLETLLINGTLSEFWNDLEGLQKVQAKIKDKTNELKELKSGLLSDKKEVARKEKELIAHKITLSDKKEIVEYNKTVKNKLLSETKNKESNYQKILDEKLAIRKAFQSELREYEDQLRMAIDPESIPEAGFSILAWPVDKVYITQFFGHTAFAAKNPKVYGSGGHNGVDFRASIGTKIKTALSGTVVAVGDTDESCPHASYGKWVFVRHNNGLSTLYAHFSKIKVAPGQILVTGDLVGYSGNTGYSTGPHLHFGVYATQGVEVKKYNFKSCKGKSTIMPLITRRDAYLNPMSYLPEYKH